MSKPEQMSIPSDWLPTVENLNALPGPVRNYIASIETNADPAGMIRENVLLKDELRILGATMYGYFGEKR